MTSVHSAQHPTFSRRSAAALAAAGLFLSGCGEEAKTPPCRCRSSVKGDARSAGTHSRRCCAAR